MVDVAAEMRAVEAEVGGRMGAAIAGVKFEASKASGAGNALKSGLRGLRAKVAGLGVVAMVALALVVVAACASPIAVWSAYHSGKAIEAERERADAARAVAAQATADKAAIASASKRLAARDAADQAEIARLHHIAARLSHKPATHLCPTTVYDVLHGAGYTPVPGHQ